MRTIRIIVLLLTITIMAACSRPGAQQPSTTEADIAAINELWNQYATADGLHANRYDVTVLVNGLPMVHIELKRRGVAITEAFNQINRYQRESFWADSGLFEYVQLFVISNGTHSKYYSNTTRAKHIKESGKTKAKQGKKSSNSFEFTSWWADAANKPITELMDFAKTFFAKHSLQKWPDQKCLLFFLHSSSLILHNVHVCRLPCMAYSQAL